MAPKKMTSFRLGNTTQYQIEWLAKRLGGLTATDVITLAVADLYERKQEEFRTRLTRMDEKFILSVGGIPIAAFGQKDYQSLPKAAKSQITAGSPYALVDLVMGLAKRPEAKITFFPDGIQQVYGFEIEPKGDKRPS
jgi:hypothetical protein